MSGHTPYDPGRNYLLGGGMLNRIFEEIHTNRLLKSDEYELEILRGKGTRIKDLAVNLRQRWDLIPGEEGTWKLLDPLVWAGYDLSGDTLEVTNDGVELAEGVLVLEVDDVEESPYTLSLVMLEGDPPALYEFDEETDDLLEARFPIWRIADGESPGSIQIGDLHATKLVGPSPLTLASHLVLVPDRPMLAFAPRLV